MDEGRQLIASYAGAKADRKRLIAYFETIKAEIDAHVDETFETVGKEERQWTVAEFEQARGGRKSKFRSLISQNLIRPGNWTETYVTSYEPKGGFATAISITGANDTEIHTHYNANDELQAAHFKPSSERYAKGHSLNSLTPQQIPAFVEGPMETKYGGKPPWGPLVTKRKP
ncbi:MAG: hypothetical protein D6722_00660 [Bacteroidetes bacterium]|nr:MAG: hypothetical protein D6722_00660 [Bacteroidota bacterium]